VRIPILVIDSFDSGLRICNSNASVVSRRKKVVTWNLFGGFQSFAFLMHLFEAAFAARIYGDGAIQALHDIVLVDFVLWSVGTDIDRRVDLVSIEECLVFRKQHKVIWNL
jgi:hypothetical protein